MSRIMITLELNEMESLHLLADREQRDPRQQAALLVVHGLENLGYLQKHTPPFQQETDDTIKSAPPN